LTDVSFALEKSEILAIVGGSGCGKSTLAKILTGLLSSDAGEILWEGRALTDFSRLERARKIQMIFQDPYASLNPKLTVGSQIREVLRLMGASSEQAVTLLESVGLHADVLNHYPFQFSGGQRQRVAIARALAMNPELLVADEPLSALDVTTQAQILDLLTRLKASRNLTVLFITHDLAVASQVADRIIVLHEGAIVEEGTASAVLGSPRHPYTQALLNAVPATPC
jgi:ABC-type glutathione transport system ATPase component